MKVKEKNRLEVIQTNGSQPQTEEVQVRITPPKMRTMKFEIVGTAPYVQLKFNEKVKNKMLERMATKKKGGRKADRETRQYEQEYKDAQHVEANEGWNGIPASGFRCAMVDACRLVNFKMILAKSCVFIEADGFGTDGSPLVKIIGEPEMCRHPVRNANGSMDIRTRAMWRNWKASVRVRWDADQFSENDIANLLARVGDQVGIGEGRPSSKDSVGMGWGTFRLV